MNSCLSNSVEERPVRKLLRVANACPRLQSYQTLLLPETGHISMLNQKGKRLHSSRSLSPPEGLSGEAGLTRKQNKAWPGLSLHPHPARPSLGWTEQTGKKELEKVVPTPQSTIPNRGLTAVESCSGGPSRPLIGAP